MQLGPKRTNTNETAGTTSAMWEPCVTYAATLGLMFAPSVDFVTAWGAVQMLGVLLHRAHQKRFYRWWTNSGMTDSCRRGFSTFGYDLFGIVPMPRLSPAALDLVVDSYAAALGAMVLTQGLARTVFTWVAAGLSLLYFSSLWAERVAAYHKETMTLMVFFFLLCGVDNAFYIQAYVASVYIASVAQKCICSIISGCWWAHHSPHHFLWLALFNKPRFPSFQRMLFLNRAMVCIGGNMSLVVEAMPFLSLFVHPSALEAVPAFRTALAVLLLTFHLGVVFAQGIDYVTFWAPVTLIFVRPMVAGGASASAQASLPTIMSLAQWDAVEWWSVAGCFLLFQLVFAATFAEAWNINIPPFTSCPMFALAQPLDVKCPQHYVVADEAHSRIKYERLEWQFPWAAPGFSMEMNPEDEDKVPFRYVGFGYVRTRDELPLALRQWVSEDFGSGVYFVGNDQARLTPAVRDQITSLMKRLHGPKSNYDPYTHLPELYEDMRAITSAIGYAPFG